MRLSPLALRLLEHVYPDTLGTNLDAIMPRMTYWLALKRLNLN